MNFSALPIQYRLNTAAAIEVAGKGIHEFHSLGSRGWCRDSGGDMAIVVPGLIIMMNIRLEEMRGNEGESVDNRGERDMLVQRGA